MSRPDDNAMDCSRGHRLLLLPGSVIGVPRRPPGPRMRRRGVASRVSLPAAAQPLTRPLAAPQGGPRRSSYGTPVRSSNRHPPRRRGRRRRQAPSRPRKPTRPFHQFSPPQHRRRPRPVERSPGASAGTAYSITESRTVPARKPRPPSRSWCYRGISTAKPAGGGGPTCIASAVCSGGS